MKVMVTFNVATVHDIANGTRADVIDIILDEREPHSDPTGSIVPLHYPPKYILLRFGNGTVCHLPGLPDNVWPLQPMKKTFTISDIAGHSKKVTRRQLPLTAAYALTDYRSQGQTIVPVIVDIGRPPTGELTPFNVYVALSRAKGRDSIRLLRDFDEQLFTTHPCQYLREEDSRLSALSELTTTSLLLPHETV
jgi:hypothetical protein